jgi:peptidoglycan/xylan/chitin deacetylase (PgdA/CDA1 family)
MTNPNLVGDGVSDDAAAIQSMLHSRESAVYFPPPKHYKRKPRLSCSSLAAFPLLYAMIFSARAEMALVAEGAKGGTLIACQDGRQGVCIEAMVSPDAGYSWTWDKPLSPGWWEVNIDFASEANASPWQTLTIATGQKPALALGELGSAASASSLRFWFYTRSEFNSLAINASRSMPLRTRPIAQIRFTKAMGSPLPAQTDFILLDIPADGTDQLKLPEGLPQGNWKITPKSADTKIPSGSLFVLGAGGTKVKAPLSAVIHVSSDGPLASLAWDHSSKLSGFVLQYIAPFKPAIPLKLNGEPMPALELRQLERETLILQGIQPIGELPSLPVFPGGKTVAIVTSWDDGPEADLRCAALLKRHGFKGTFFICESSPVRKGFLDALEKLGMEIGSHSVNHPHAWLIDPRQWNQECLQMRTSLEQTLKHPVISFAYPYNHVPAFDKDGDYVLGGVRNAGYWSGRSTDVGAETIDACTEPLSLKTNGHFLMPPEKMDGVWNQARAQPGSIFYFWGHTYEIEKANAWDSFEWLLSRYENKPEAWYAAQGQLSLWRWLRANTKWETIRIRPDGVEVAFSHPKLDSYLQELCPISIKLPPGVTKVIWNHVEVPVGNGILTQPSRKQTPDTNNF